MVSFRPLPRSLPLASRAALFHSCASPAPVLRHVAAARRTAVPVFSKLGAAPGFVPSSLPPLAPPREQVQVLLLLFGGGKHAEQVSSPFFFFRFRFQQSTAHCNWVRIRMACKRCCIANGKDKKRKNKKQQQTDTSKTCAVLLCCCVGSASASDAARPKCGGEAPAGPLRSTTLFLDLACSNVHKTQGNKQQPC